LIVVDYAVASHPSGDDSRAEFKKKSTMLLRYWAKVVDE
jgi:hypothetical protein